MSASVAAALALAAALLAVPLWPGPAAFARRWAPRRRARLPWPVLAVYAGPVVLLAAAALAAVVASGAPAPRLGPVVAVLAAVVAGGPVTAAVLEIADRSGETDHITAEPAVLRGGAWIGGLERAAVTATLLGGWPEGLAVVLGIKGLARYPELRLPAAAERFIIGTFTSVLWAAACAGIGHLLRT